MSKVGLPRIFAALLLLFPLTAGADPAFDGTLKELNLDTEGGFNGAPEGMTFIVPPGGASKAEFATFSDGNKGARLTVKAVGDTLACTQSVPLGPQVFLRARLRVPEIAPGGGSWMGMNAELRTRDDKGNLVSPPGLMFAMVTNIRQATPDWTDVEAKLAVPAGASQGEFCFRFVLSTGIVEIDKVHIVSRRDGATSMATSAATSAAAPAPTALVSTAPTTSVPAPTPTFAVPAPTVNAPMTTSAPTISSVPNSAVPSASDGSSRGFTLRLDQRASSVACTKWVSSSAAVTVFGTVDISAVNPEAVDWSGLAVEAYARDATDRPVTPGGVPYAPLFVTTHAGAGQKFSVSWKPPAGTSRVRLCARFSDAAGNAAFDWTSG